MPSKLRFRSARRISSFVTALAHRFRRTDSCVHLGLVLQLGVQRSAQQNDERADGKPHQQHDDTTQRTVDLVGFAKA